MSAAWRILIADDHPVVRAGLRALLAAEPRCTVVAEAGSLAELRAVVAREAPDLILLDLSFGDQDALTALPDLLAAPGSPRVVVLTMHDDVAFARTALAAGAHGYLLKEAAAEELIRAVTAVLGGSTYLSPTLGARLAATRPDPAQRLTARERDVLALLARGYTNAEMAKQLMVSLRTLEANRASLRLRLGADSRAELVDAARRLGLLP